MNCARCDYKTNPETEGRPKEQLYNHSIDSGHPICLCCRTSLQPDEQQTCETCLTKSRTLLAGVILMWEELPMHLGHLRGATYDNDRPNSADGRPLPGGDVLVLLSGGSMGRSENGLTSRKQDAQSVAHCLASWQEDWQELRYEPTNPNTFSHAGSSRIVRAAARYLEIHARWAAINHPAFDAYLEELQALHKRLERATGRDEHIQRAEAECFQCGQDSLIREITDRGYADDWTCQHCGQRYDWDRYLLAVQDRLRQTPEAGWSLPAHVALVLQVPVQTVLTWAKRGLIGTACILGDRRMRVWYADAEARAHLSKNRKKAS